MNDNSKVVTLMILMFAMFAFTAWEIVIIKDSIDALIRNQCACKVVINDGMATCEAITRAGK